jgi:hypothetical protein
MFLVLQLFHSAFFILRRSWSGLPQITQLYKNISILRKNFICIPYDRKIDRHAKISVSNTNDSTKLTTRKNGAKTTHQEIAAMPVILRIARMKTKSQTQGTYFIIQPHLVEKDALHLTSRTNNALALQESYLMDILDRPKGIEVPNTSFSYSIPLTDFLPVS